MLTIVLISINEQILSNVSGLHLYAHKNHSLSVNTIGSSSSI